MTRTRIPAPRRLDGVRAVAFALTLSCLAGAAGAQTGGDAVDCGGTYVVRAGDTLFRIARRVYGDGQQADGLYRANREVIGPDPGRIEIGMALSVPCPPGTAPEAAEAPEEEAPLRPATLPAPAVEPDPEPFAPDPAPEETAPAPAEEAAPPPPPAAPGPIRITLLSDGPFPSGGEPGQGLVARLVAAALADTVPAREVVLATAARDADGPIAALAAGEAEVALPAIRPDCARAAEFTARQLCERLLWSDPVYEQVLTLYMRAEDPEPVATADLEGLRLCRTVSTPRYALADAGYAGRGAAVLERASALDCFIALDRGEADAAVVPADAARAAGLTAEMPPRLVRHGLLDRRVTLHAAISREAPQAEATRRAINRGLERMRLDGRWFKLVRAHIERHLERAGGG